MHTNIRTMQLLIAGLSLAAGAAIAREPIPSEAFARVPAIQSVSMSPDGENLVALVTSPGSDHKETALATWDLDNLEAGSVVTPSGDSMKFIGASALKADKVLVAARQEWTGSLRGCGEGRTTGATRTFITKVYLTGPKQEDFDEAFEKNVRRTGVSETTQRCLELAGTASLVDMLPQNPDTVIISRLNGLTLDGAYYRYNLNTGETELLFSATSRTSPVLFHPRTGELLVRSKLEPLSGTEFEQRISIRDPETGEFAVHDKFTHKLSERHSVNVAGIDLQTGKLWVLTDMFSDQVQAWAYDPATREFDDEPLLTHPKYSITNLIIDSQEAGANQVIGFTVGNMLNEQVFVDPEMIAIQKSLKQLYPDQSVRITEWTDDRSRVLFNTESAQNPTTYGLLVDRKEVKTLGSQRPWIEPGNIGEQRWVTYQARDGMKIPAILDLPAGWTPEDGPLPTVIHPHGGPWARDFGGWDRSGWVPFLTSRGYAVLRPQYRGSAGLGRELWLAGDAQWGLSMQDDLDDGAAWLVSQGIADPERLAIFGYSYGGFAAAAATVRPDSPYQCAIAGAPVTDLGRLGTSWSDNRLQRILQGTTVKGMDPMLNTDKANIPVLVFVGDRDVRTPKFHAEGFYQAVQDTVPAQLEIIPDMPHSMPWYYRHQKTTLGLIEDFLAKDCGPQGL